MTIGCRVLIVSLLAFAAHGRLAEDANESRADLDYFPSRLHAAIFRNWDIVPHARLAAVLGTDTATIRKDGRAIGLTPPANLTPEEIRRNVEMVLRRNWPLFPRNQIEQLLAYSPKELDEFLGKEIFLRALLAGQPAGLTPLNYAAPDERTRARALWFGKNVRQHLGAVASAPEEPRLAYIAELCRAHDPAGFIRGTKPKSGDADLRTGWRISIPENPGVILRTAVADFSDYCKEVQHLRAARAWSFEGLAPLTPTPSLKEKEEHTIQLVLDQKFKRAEAYSLLIQSNGIAWRSG